MDEQQPLTATQIALMVSQWCTDNESMREMGLEASHLVRNVQASELDGEEQAACIALFNLEHIESLEAIDQLEEAQRYLVLRLLVLHPVDKKSFTFASRRLKDLPPK